MIGRCTRILLAAAIVSFLTVLPAAAHVNVSSEDAAPGGYGMITFRVPTESDTASTTEVIISLPEDTPITSVSTRPVAGWTATPTNKKLPQPQQTEHGEIDSYVATVTWKADSPAAGIKPGEFELFSLSAGPLPEVDSIAFPTVQRYSDGTEVAWDEIGTGSGAEPENPAPTLTLQSTADDPAAAAPPQPARQPTGWMAPVGLGVAAVALIIAIIAVLRTAKPR